VKKRVCHLSSIDAFAKWLELNEFEEPVNFVLYVTGSTFSLTPTGVEISGIPLDQLLSALPKILACLFIHQPFVQSIFPAARSTTSETVMQGLRAYIKDQVPSALVRWDSIWQRKGKLELDPTDDEAQIALASPLIDAAMLLLRGCPTAIVADISSSFSPFPEFRPTLLQVYLFGHASGTAGDTLVSSSALRPFISENRVNPFRLLMLTGSAFDASSGSSSARSAATAPAPRQPLPALAQASAVPLTGEAEAPKPDAKPPAVTQPVQAPAAPVAPTSVKTPLAPTVPAAPTVQAPKAVGPPTLPPAEVPAKPQPTKTPASTASPANQLAATSTASLDPSATAFVPSAVSLAPSSTGYATVSAEPEWFAGARGIRPPIDSRRGVFFCSICNCEVFGESNLALHLASDKHKRKEMLSNPALAAAKQDPTVSSMLMNPKNFFSCDVCGVVISGSINIEQHLNGAQHKKNAARAVDPNTFLFNPGNAFSFGM